MTSATAQPGHVDFLNPDGLARNPAFTNVAVVSGAVRTIYIGGQDAITADGEIVGKGDLAAQTAQILANIDDRARGGRRRPRAHREVERLRRRGSGSQGGLSGLPAGLG